MVFSFDSPILLDCGVQVDEGRLAVPTSKKQGFVFITDYVSPTEKATLAFVEASTKVEIREKIVQTEKNTEAIFLSWHTPPISSRPSVVLTRNLFLFYSMR